MYARPEDSQLPELSPIPNPPESALQSQIWAKAPKLRLTALQPWERIGELPNDDLLRAHGC